MSDLSIARGTAWVVVAIYVFSLLLEIRRAAPVKVRIIWTLGALALTAHVSWTMWVIHHGSLREAYLHTAQQTQALVGVSIGEGVYINFAMLGFWLFDAAAWWSSSWWIRRRPAFALLIHLCFAFLFLNAAVIFASPLGRWAGVSAIILLIAAWLHHRSQAEVHKPTIGNES